MNDDSDVDIFVLAYNNEEIINETLCNLRDNVLPTLNCRVVVLDNGSSDRTAEIIRSHDFAECIRLEQNRYFSGGANYLLKHASAPHVFFMSSDVRPSNDTLLKLIEFAKLTPDAGVIGCKSVLRCGSVERTAKRAYTPNMLHKVYGTLGLLPRMRAKLDKHYYYLDSGFPFLHPTPVDVVQDSFIYIKGELLFQGLTFDEDLKLYFTEDQLSKSVALLGHRTYYYPATFVEHQLQATTSKTPNLSTLIYRNDCVVFCKKYIGSARAVILSCDMLVRRILVRVAKFFRFSRRLNLG